MARVHVHRDPTEMVASVKQSATRAFVAVLALLAKSYEVVLAVSRDSSEQELLKAYRKLCSFMSGFTDAFQSSLATPCKIFLAENPSGDKVEVTNLNLKWVRFETYFVWIWWFDPDGSTPFGRHPKRNIFDIFKGNPFSNWLPEGTQRLSGPKAAQNH